MDGTLRHNQREAWEALVDYLRQFGNGACLNALLEDGPDDTTDFRGLLEKFKRERQSTTQPKRLGL